jgi:hypothetical protein
LRLRPDFAHAISFEIWGKMDAEDSRTQLFTTTPPHIYHITFNDIIDLAFGIYVVV